MVKQKLLILGAGGHGQVAKEIAEAMNQFEKIDFLDDNSSIAIGKCQDYMAFLEIYPMAFVAIGDNKLRAYWQRRLKMAGFLLPALVHPLACLMPSAHIEKGALIGARAVVASRATIGEGVIVGMGALIDHDSIIGAYAHINTGAIIKAGSLVESNKKIDAGAVYSGKDYAVNYNFEIGV